MKKFDEKTELERRLEEEAARQAAEQAQAGAVVEPEFIEALEPGASEGYEQALEHEIEQLKDQLLRARAEFDNYRKRVARDQDRARQLAAESLMRALLPILDNLDLALQHADSGSGVAEGVKMVSGQLAEILGQHGLAPITSVGERFDPNIHEAISQIASEDVPADHVAQEFQRGYRLGGIVLRPARVVVSTGPGNTAQSQEET